MTIDYTNMLPHELWREIISYLPHDRAAIACTCRRLAAVVRDPMLNPIPLLRPVLDRTPEERRKFIERMRGTGPISIIRFDKCTDQPEFFFQKEGVPHLALTRYRTHPGWTIIFQNLQTKETKTAPIPARENLTFLGIDPFFLAVHDGAYDWHFLNSNLETSAPPIRSSSSKAPLPFWMKTRSKPPRLGLAVWNPKKGGRYVIYLESEGKWQKKYPFFSGDFPMTIGSSSFVLSGNLSTWFSTLCIDDDYGQVKPLNGGRTRTYQPKDSLPGIAINKIPYFVYYHHNQLTLSPLELPHKKRPPAPLWQITLPFVVKNDPSLHFIPLGKGFDCVLFVSRATQGQVDTARILLKSNGTHTMLAQDIFNAQSPKFLGVIASETSWGLYYGHDWNRITKVELLGAPPPPRIKLLYPMMDRALYCVTLALTFHNLRLWYEVANFTRHRFFRTLESLVPTSTTVLMGWGIAAGWFQEKDREMRGAGQILACALSLWFFPGYFRLVYRVGWRHLRASVLAISGWAHLWSRQFVKAPHHPVKHEVVPGLLQPHVQG